MQKTTAGLITALLFLLAAPLILQARTSQFQLRQATKMKRRMQLLETYQRNLEKTRQRAVGELKKFFEWCVDNGTVGNAADSYALAKRNYPDYDFGEKVTTAFSAAPPPESCTDKRTLRKYESKRKGALKSFSRVLMGLVTTCNQVELYDLSFDLLKEALRIDPDNRAARYFFGEVRIKVPGEDRYEWMSGYSGKQVQKGNVWIDGWGWVPRGYEKRYRNGECLDNGKWISVKEANKLHSTIDKMWEIESEHFIVYSTLERSKAIKISVALEDFHAYVYRNYIVFFLKGGASKKVLFGGTAIKKKLVTHFFATQSQFMDYVSKNLHMRNIGLIGASQGFYTNATGQSYFWTTGDLMVDMTVVFHETTHQILGEFSGGRYGQTWMVEGLAVYMEHVHWKDGKIYTPAWEEGCINQAYELDGKFRQAADFMKLSGDNFHVGNRSLNYAMAGAFTNFLMNANDKIYRSAWMEYCYDDYRSSGTAALHEYLGIDQDVLEAEWKKFYDEHYKGIADKIQKMQERIYKEKVKRAIEEKIAEGMQNN